jgi:hypothetical protein
MVLPADVKSSFGAASNVAPCPVRGAGEVESKHEGASVEAESDIATKGMADEFVLVRHGPAILAPCGAIAM